MSSFIHESVMSIDVMLHTVGEWHLNVTNVTFQRVMKMLHDILLVLFYVLFELYFGWQMTVTYLTFEFYHLLGLKKFGHVIIK